MVKNKKTKAFSLVDAIIILSVVAIAIAVATPILTRKIVNIDDIMSFGHGRYEIYYKEIVSYDNQNYYEKAIGGNTNQIRVYERKTDSDYYKITGSIAESDKNGNKDTLYEEFNNVPVIRDANGKIIKVKINGKEVLVGGRYIIESSDLVYYKYDQNKHKRLDGGIKLPDNQRIIEGMLTTKYPKKPNHWIISHNNEKNFEGEVTSDAFERTISGTKTISENYLEPDKKTGKVTGTFDPSDNIKNAVVHAQGGGGAGGGVDSNNLGGSKSLNELSKAELTKIKNELYENFKKVVPSEYHKGADVVIGTCANCLSKEDEWRKFAKNGYQWLLLDTATGDLIGKYNTTNPLSMVLPDQVLSYTKEATTSTSSVFEKYTMPKILTYKDLGNKFFYTGSSVKSNSDGTKASDIVVTVAQDVDLPCMRTYYGYDGTALDNSVKPTKVAKCVSVYKQYKNIEYYDTKAVQTKICPISVAGGSGAELKKCNGVENCVTDWYNAAKIDYSNEIKFNSWVDKIKFYLDRNEIDLNYPIAHAGRTADCYEGYNSGKPKEIYGSCSTKECSCSVSGNSLTCSNVSTSAKCLQGTSSQYKSTKKSTTDVKEKCSAYECRAICNDFYYNCSYHNGDLIESGSKNNCGESYYINSNTCKIDVDIERKPHENELKIYGGKGGVAGGRAYVCASPAAGMVAIRSVEQASRSTNNPAATQTLTITKENAHNAQLNFDNTYTWGNKGGSARRIIDVYSRETGSLIETHTATSNGGGPGQTYQQEKVKLEITKSPAASAVLAMVGDLCSKYHVTPGMIGDIPGLDIDNVMDEYKSGLSEEDQKYFVELVNNPGQIYDLQNAINQIQMSTLGDNMLQSNAAFNDNGTLGTTNPNSVYEQLNKNWWVQSAEDGSFSYTKNDTPLVTVNLTPVPYEITTTNDWVCHLQDKAYRGNNGANGTKSDDCAEKRGIGSDDIPYNHIYAWVVPYRTNSITYSQAGEAGEYKVAKVPRVTGAFKITLGKGGVWENDAWKSGKIQGPNGGDTIVKMGKDRKGGSDKHIVTAKGGKGGGRALLSNSYSLCFAETSDKNNKGKCYDSEGNEISCCQGEQGTRSSRDIYETAIKYSIFENTKSLVGQSELIGLGLGRGAEASGARAGNEMVAGIMKIYNISYDSGCEDCYKYRNIYSKESATATKEDYKNIPIKPSALNFKGGDGAVIITW